MLDPVTEYAQAVLDGDIVAGESVRGACMRHMRDMESGWQRGIHFDPAAAARVIAFFAKVLRLNGGAYEGVPFVLLPWQAFVAGSLMGWKSDPSCTERAPSAAALKAMPRRFRVAYIETGKGSGKSPFAAGLGMYGLVADGEARAEIYAAATKRDQAMILFRDAVAMFDHSPHLRSRLKSSGSGEGRWNLAYHATRSWFRPIASDDGQNGPRPHFVLIDEIHEHKTDHVIEALRAGTKSRRQALIVMITNAGAGRTGPCWSYHEYAVRLARQVSDEAQAEAGDAFFSFVCGLDDGDDPFKDEACWLKANPSMQHAELPGLKYLREQVSEARGMPSKESIVRRLCFCQWTDARTPWLTQDVWMSAYREYDEASLYGRRAYAGLDLGSTTDLTALVLMVEPAWPGDPWHLLAYPFLPDEDITQREDRDRVPYTAWRRSGQLLTTPGRAVSKLHVLQHLVTLAESFDLQLLAYDRWRIADLKQMATDNNIELPKMVEYGQGFKDMSPAIDRLETGLMDGSIVHNGHPVLTWCAANATPVTDPAGNRKMDKSASIGRIDVLVAAIMAVGVSGRETGAIDIDELLKRPLIMV